MIETMRGLAATSSRIADLVDRQERETRIVVDEVVEPPRPQAVAGDDSVAVVRLAAAGHHAGLDEIDDAIGDDVAVDAEVAAVLEVPQRLVGNAAEPDLQRRAVVDDGGDVARDPLRGLARRRMAVFRHRRVDADQRIEAVEMDEAVAVGARHRRVDLGDHPARDGQHRRREVDGDPEADEAARIGRGDLKQRDVDRQPAARQQARHLLEADRHVVELTAAARPRTSLPTKNVRWRYRVPARPPPAAAAEVVTKLTNSRSAGPGRIASSSASRLRGAAQPVPR